MAKHTNIRKTTKEEMTERHKSLQLARVCSFIIAVAIAFCLGFILRGNDVIMQFLGIDRPSVANSNPGLTTSGNTYDSIGARVAEVEGLLSSESLCLKCLTVIRSGTADRAVTIAPTRKMFPFGINSVCPLVALTKVSPPVLTTA